MKGSDFSNSQQFRYTIHIPYLRICQLPEHHCSDVIQVTVPRWLYTLHLIGPQRHNTSTLCSLRLGLHPKEGHLFFDKYGFIRQYFQNTDTVLCNQILVVRFNLTTRIWLNKTMSVFWKYQVGGHKDRTTAGNYIKLYHTSRKLSHCPLVLRTFSLSTSVTYSTLEVWKHCKTSGLPGLITSAIQFVANGR